MGMEEYIDTIELKQMKEQIAILNSKLDAEVVVNEKLLRKVIKNKVSGMNRYVGIMNSLALLLIPFYIWACPYLGISWWFCSVFCLFLFIAVMHGYFTHKRLRTNDLMSEDLLVVARKLKEIKSRYSIWRKFSIPFIIILLCWLFIELQLAGNSNIIIFCVSLIFSFREGYKQYHMMQRKLDEIQQEIDEIMKE